MKKDDIKFKVLTTEPNPGYVDVLYLVNVNKVGIDRNGKFYITDMDMMYHGMIYNIHDGV